MIKDYYGKYEPIQKRYKIKLKEIYLFKHINREENNDDSNITEYESTLDSNSVSNDIDYLSDINDFDDDARSVSSYNSINSYNSFNSLKTDFSGYSNLTQYNRNYNNNKQKLKRLIILNSFKVNFILFKSDNSIVEQIRLRINNIYENELMNEINKKINKNYIAKNVYYKDINTSKYIHIPDYLPPKKNKNNVYNKLRMGNFDTICIEVE